jgi:hypothetical protein
MRSWGFFALSVELWGTLRTSVSFDLLWNKMMELEDGQLNSEQKIEDTEGDSLHGG